VTIADTTSPVITCPGNQTENVGASCQFTLVDYTGLVIASDNCGGSPTITQSPIAGTVISGTTTITMTAVDGNGNISTCTFDVVLNDAVAPSAVCQNITTYLDGAGTSTIAAADLDGGSTDNCSGITFSASQTVFTCVDLGPNNVTLTVTDGNSNTATCLSTVTVVDTVSPVASCQNITVFLDGAGTASIVAADIDNGSTDNCSTVTLAASTTAFTCVDLGPNAVTLTVTDGSGNTSTCTSIVTVVDTVSPTASCQNITIFLDGAGNALIVATDIDNGSTDNCSTVTLAASTTSFTCADLGTNSVTLTVTDGSGNTSTCTSIVTVADTISPAASCQNITAFLDGSGNATIVAADIDNGSTDNCSTVILAASTTAFTCADLGPNAVTLTVTDGSGNTSTCTSTVTIADTVSPAVTCAGNQTENPDASCNFVLPDYTGLASATDNCGGSPSITQSPAVGTVISGQTTITITADDGNGNTSNCTFDVIFDDIIAPTITCPSNQNVDFSALCDYTLIDFTGLATATDNCSGVVITQSPAIGTVITTTTAVTLTATDGAGNSANCAFDVIPADNTVPTITCPADQNELVDGNCEYIIPDYTTMVATADNCSSTITLTQSLLAGTVVGVSTQTITITADDGNGNAADCSFTLNVTDNIAPTITCPADQADSYDDNCAFALLDYTGMATIADNCGIPTITQSPVAGTLVASNTVITLTVDDGNGNTANCSFNLTLSDTTAPVVVCPSDESIYLDGNCEVVLPDYTSSGNIYDNCDNNLTITQTPNAGKVYSATEEVEVTLVATDASGNVDSCSFYVSVEADENSGCIDNVVVSDLISPNGDGKNDFWIIHETSYIIGCTVYVYNRWGQKVFEAENYDNTWGGTSQSGEKLPDGAYYYVIECDGELKYKGDISILSLKK
jgi:gliding motility-associated-like protein